MKKLTISKGKLGQKRRTEIIMMVLAILGLFVAVPVITHLLVSYNSLRQQGEYTRLGEDNFQSIIATTGILFDEDTMEEQNYTVWGNDTTPDTLIISTNDTYIISWVLNYKLDDLINNNTLKWKFSFNVTRTVRFTIHAVPSVNGLPDWSSDDITTMFPVPPERYLIEENETVELTWTALDLTQWSVITDNGYVVVTIFPYDHDDTYSIGDEQEFLFEMETPPLGTLKEITAWQWGAGIMGIILLLIALASTPYWNPADKSNPGYIDNKIRGIANRKKNKKK